MVTESGARNHVRVLEGQERVKILKSQFELVGYVSIFKTQSPFSKEIESFFIPCQFLSPVYLIVEDLLVTFWENECHNKNYYILVLREAFLDSCHLESQPPTTAAISD